MLCLWLVFKCIVLYHPSSLAAVGGTPALLCLGAFLLCVVDRRSGILGAVACSVTGVVLSLIVRFVFSHFLFTSFRLACC
jgi:putative flippase GtrA